MMAPFISETGSKEQLVVPLSFPGLKQRGHWHRHYLGHLYHWIIVVSPRPIAQSGAVFFHCGEDCSP